MKKPVDAFCRRLSWEDLDPPYLRQLVEMAKGEDLEGSGLREAPAHPGDPSTALLPENQEGEARLRARTPQVFCGAGMVPLVLEAYGGEAVFVPATADGARVEAGAVLGMVRGKVSTLLRAERPMLNFLQHLGGVATETARYVQCLDGSRTRLLDTRKTTPGFRMLEKYAVASGGGWNHRLGLFDRIMLKDNHLAAHHGDIGNMIARARARAMGRMVQVEVDTLCQLRAALDAEPDIVLLDNFSMDDLSRAVDMCAGRIRTEASGGITLERLPDLGCLGLDFISCGAVVHQSRWVDIGMDWKGADHG